jgi:glutamate racemase
MTPDAPIGVFDSGVGGLSVLREIRRELPWEDLIYVADSGHAPYGDKPAEAVEARSLTIAGFLIGEGAKAIVVACNTATGAAARVLRDRFAVPIVAMEPAVKPAVLLTRSGVVGVLATRRTLASPSFTVLIERVAGGAEIVLQPCPGLVERIESGDLDGDYTRALLADYLRPPIARGADTLVLGCTHYPHLRPLIGELAGPGVSVLDSGAAVARQVRHRLDSAGLLAPAGRPGRERFWTTGCPVGGQDLVARLWQSQVALERLPEISVARPDR